MKHIEATIKNYPTTRIGIVASCFNQAIVDQLLDDTLTELAAQEVDPEQITVVRVPGAHELSFAAAQLAKTHDVLIAIGAVIRGETPHFDYVCSACVQTLNQVMLTHDIPLVFGVLTTNTVEQAWARVKGEAVTKADKSPQGGGHYFARTALQMLNVKQTLAAL